MCVDYYSGDIDPRGIVVVSGWHRHKIRIGFQAIDDTRKKKEKGKKIRVCHFGVVKGSLIWEPSYLFTISQWGELFQSVIVSNLNYAEFY